MSHIVDRCLGCNGNLEKALDFKQFPIVDSFVEIRLHKNDIKQTLFDQTLMICQKCGHGQLQNFLNQSEIYGNPYGYHFRTSESITAKKSIKFFLDRLSEFTNGRKFKKIIDIGCNDLYLLDLFQNIAIKRVGIDPIWKDTNHNKNGIEVFGDTIENLDLKSIINFSPDLIICRHTFEHIHAPRLVLEKIFNICNEDTILAFEFPGFDAQIQKYRFDQIFHDHINYFSLKSFDSLLGSSGFNLYSYFYNYNHWSSLISFFGIDETRKLKETIKPIDISQVRKRYEYFKNQMQLCYEIISNIDKEPIYGYGATELLPILFYHLKINPAWIRAIVDDSTAKSGLFYQYLSHPVLNSNEIKDITNNHILITSMDSTFSILKNLVKISPKSIINPLIQFYT